MSFGDNSLVGKYYIDSNIVWKENVKTLRRFSKDDFLMEAHAYMRRHQGAKGKHFDVSDVIYHKLSYGAASYTLNGENVNVMLEFLFQFTISVNAK